MKTGRTRIYNPHLEALSREELMGLQLRRLTTLLNRVAQRNDFFRRRFAKHGVAPDQIRSLEDFAERVPTLGKQDLLEDQAERPPHGTRLDLPPGELALTCLTSGTTGLGQEVHPLTFHDLEELGDSFCYKFHWDGVRQGDRAYTMWPIGLQIAGLAVPRAFQKYGVESYLVPILDATRKLETMRRFPPNYIVTVPAYLTRLTVLCQQMGIDPRRDFPDLRAIDATTQAYTLDWAREMEDFWGAPLTEMFGATQSVPGIMFCCERGVRDGGRRGMLHALEHRLLFEVIDPETGRHVGSGAEGELVLTTLTRAVAPMIRFRMGDRVIYQAHTECPCGRPFAGIQAGTVARYDDMIKIKGQNVWPEAVDAAVFGFPEVEEYKATVFIDADGRETVAVQYEVKRTAQLSDADRAALPARLSARVRDRVGVSMQFTEAAHDSLPRYEFKTRRWTDERQAGRRVEHYLAR